MCELHLEIVRSCVRLATRARAVVTTRLVEQLGGGDLALEPLDLSRHRRRLGAREQRGVLVARRIADLLPERRDALALIVEIEVRLIEERPRTAEVRVVHAAAAQGRGEDAALDRVEPCLAVFQLALVHLLLLDAELLRRAHGLELGRLR